MARYLEQRIPHGNWSLYAGENPGKRTAKHEARSYLQSGNTFGSNPIT